MNLKLNEHSFARRNGGISTSLASCKGSRYAQGVGSEGFAVSFKVLVCARMPFVDSSQVATPYRIALFSIALSLLIFQDRGRCSP
jgi:hypothetical protein